jgi:hypothetical protein
MSGSEPTTFEGARARGSVLIRVSRGSMAAGRTTRSDGCLKSPSLSESVALSSRDRRRIETVVTDSRPRNRRRRVGATLPVVGLIRQSIAAYCSLLQLLGGASLPSRRAPSMEPILLVVGLNLVQAVDPILMAPHCSRVVIGFEGRRRNVIHMFPIYSMREKWRSQKASSGSLRRMCRFKLELCEKIDFEN